MLIRYPQQRVLPPVAAPVHQRVLQPGKKHPPYLQRGRVPGGLLYRGIYQGKALFCPGNGLMAVNADVFITLYQGAFQIDFTGILAILASQGIVAHEVQRPAGCVPEVVLPRRPPSKHRGFSRPAKTPMPCVPPDCPCGHRNATGRRGTARPSPRPLWPGCSRGPREKPDGCTPSDRRPPASRQTGAAARRPIPLLTTHRMESDGSAHKLLTDTRKPRSQPATFHCPFSFRSRCSPLFLPYAPAISTSLR